MATLSELIAQKEAIERQIEEARQNELKDAIAQVKALIASHGLTEKDIFGKGGKGKSGGKVAAKYKNPETGETWTGRGRAPKWLEGKNKEDFVI